MTRKVRQEALFTGGLLIGDMASPAVRSSIQQAKSTAGVVISNIISLTQTEYDAIAEPDTETIYIIIA
ncbi:MAG: hypothetical protein KAS85_08890 [Rhodobacteraceae bacterium]|nr:hypothetical protein [Paracoccaceae bacterium]